MTFSPQFNDPQTPNLRPGKNSHAQKAARNNFGKASRNNSHNNSLVGDGYGSEAGNEAGNRADNRYGGKQKKAQSFAHPTAPEIKTQGKSQPKK